jgi:hypothetical protein
MLELKGLTRDASGAANAINPRHFSYRGATRSVSPVDMERVGDAPRMFMSLGIYGNAAHGNAALRQQSATAPSYDSAVSR